MISDVASHQLKPAKFIDEANILLRESRGFLNSLPRQLNMILRRMNSPDYKTKIYIEGVEDLRKTILVSFNLLFLGIIIAALFISSSLIYPHEAAWKLGGMPALSLIGYIAGLALSIAAFINYIKKS